MTGLCLSLFTLIVARISNPGRQHLRMYARRMSGRDTGSGEVDGSQQETMSCHYKYTEPSCIMDQRNACYSFVLMDICVNMQVSMDPYSLHVLTIGLYF